MWQGNFWAPWSPLPWSLVKTQVPKWWQKITTRKHVDKPLQPTTQFNIGWFSHDTNHS